MVQETPLHSVLSDDGGQNPADKPDDEPMIFCVDDEPDVLQLLKLELEGEPYGVITAASGEQGLELLKTERIAVVLSDQRMPGLSGDDFLRQVKEGWPDTF